PGNTPAVLVQRRVGGEAPAAAARLRRQMRRPQPGRLGTRAQLAQELLRRVVFAVQRLLVRIDVLLHEGAVLGAKVGEFARDRQLRRSTIIAIPCPPPTHIVSSPICLSSVSRSFRSVFMIRAPVMP